MKSQLKKLDQIALDQIEAILEAHMDGELTLVCCEFNNEVVVGFVDLQGEIEYYGENDDDEESEIIEPSLLNTYFTINLPVNLIEVSGYDEDDKIYSSYKFYPYKQIADEVCEVLLKTPPEVMFFPNESIIKTYFSYWDRYKQVILDEYDNDDIIDGFNVSSLVKS